MGRSSQLLFVRQVGPHERRLLKELARHGPDARLVNRARAILLSRKGKRVAEIAELLDVGKSFVEYWIHRFDEHGVEELCDRPRPGRPRKADAAFEKRLIELVSTEPQKVDPVCPFTVWTADRLLLRMAHEGFPSVSDDTVRRVLHRREYAFLRPKLDLEHKQNRREKRDFLQRLAAAKKGRQTVPA